MWNTEQDKINYKLLLEKGMQEGSSEFQMQKALVNQDMGFFIGLFLQDDGVIDPGEKKLLEWVKDIIYKTPSFALIMRIGTILNAVVGEMIEAEKQSV